MNWRRYGVTDTGRGPNESGFVIEVLVYIALRLKIKKRASRWKTKIKITHSKDAGQLKKKNVVTYALKKVEMQTHRIIQFHTAQKTLIVRLHLFHGNFR